MQDNTAVDSRYRSTGVRTTAYRGRSDIRFDMLPPCLCAGRFSIIVQWQGRYRPVLLAQKQLFACSGKMRV